MSVGAAIALGAVAGLALGITAIKSSILVRSPSWNAAKPRTSSTFSWDIVYSSSPAASRASLRSKNHWVRTQRP
jgi:hypothetical protein